MIALVKFEIKKIFRNKVMLVVLIFGLLLNAFAIYTNDKMNSSNQYMNGKFKVFLFRFLPCFSGAVHIDFHVLVP